MKKLTSMKSAILLVIVFVFVGITMSYSYAEESIQISIPKGTSVPGCDIKKSCYIPDPITINIGTLVEWTNRDVAVHTVTSGSPKEGPDGIIYSDFLSPGETFAFRFNEPGAYPYFCTLHPWMEGLIVVQDDTVRSDVDYQYKELRVVDDGSTVITIQTNKPQAGKKLPIEIRFTDQDDLLLIHMNYDIRITQDGEDVLVFENAHSNDGTAEFYTRTLESDNPVDIEIGIRGIYLPSEPTRPIKDTIEFRQVPEFELGLIILFSGFVLMLLLTRYSMKQKYVFK